MRTHTATNSSLEHKTNSQLRQQKKTTTSTLHENNCNKMFVRQKRKSEEEAQTELGVPIAHPSKTARIHARAHNTAIRDFLTNTTMMVNPRSERVRINMSDVAFCDPDNSQWTRLGTCSGVLERRFKRKVTECLDNSILIVSQGVKRAQINRENLHADTEFSVLVLADLSRNHARIHLFGPSEDNHKYKTNQTQEIRLEKHIRGAHVIFDRQRSCFLEDSVPRACFSNITKKASLRDLSGCTIREIVLMDDSELIDVEFPTLEHITTRDTARLKGRVETGGMQGRPLEIYATGDSVVDLRGTAVHTAIVRLDDRASCKGLIVENSLEVHALSPDVSSHLTLSSISARFVVNLPRSVARELNTGSAATDASIGNLEIGWTDGVLQHMRDNNIPTSTTPYLLERMRQLCELSNLIRFEHEPQDESERGEDAELLFVPSVAFGNVVDLAEPGQVSNTVFHTNQATEAQQEHAPFARAIGRARNSSGVLRISASRHHFSGRTEHDRQLAPLASGELMLVVRADTMASQPSPATRTIRFFVHQPADNFEDVVMTRRLVARRSDYVTHREHPLVLYNQIVRQRNSHWERMEISNDICSSVLPPVLASRMMRATFGRMTRHPFVENVNGLEMLIRLLRQFVDGNTVYQVIRNTRLVSLLVPDLRDNHGTFGGGMVSGYSEDSDDDELQNALLASDTQYRNEQEARQQTFSLDNSYRLEDMDDEQRTQIENIRPLVPFIKRRKDAAPLDKNDPRLSSNCVVCFDDETPPDVLPVGCNCNPAKTIICSDCTPLYIRRWDKCTLCNAKLTSLQQL